MTWWSAPSSVSGSEGRAGTVAAKKPQACQPRWGPSFGAVEPRGSLCRVGRCLHRGHGSSLLDEGTARGRARARRRHPAYRRQRCCEKADARQGPSLRGSRPKRRAPDQWTRRRPSVRPLYFPACRFSSTSIRRSSLSSMRPIRKAIKSSASAMWISSPSRLWGSVDGIILLCPLAEPFVVGTPSGIAGHRPLLPI